MYSRWDRESKPAWSERNRPLFQNRMAQSPANKINVASSIQFEGQDASMTDFCKRFNCHRRINHIATAAPPKQIQIGQTFRAAAIVCSPAATGLPGPGNLGAEALTTGRHDDPATDASQVRSVCSVAPSIVRASQSAGGALSSKTRTSTTFVPVRRSGAIFAVETFFQLRSGPVSTELPLIFSWNRLAAEILNWAARGCCSSVKARRNVVSM